MMRFFLLLTCLFWTIALAADPDPALQATIEAELAAEAVIPGLPPGPPPPAGAVEDLTIQIASGLRCPVCQGLSVADSTTPTAVNIQNRIRELVAAGYERAEIEDYFVSKFGEWILLNPTSRGMNQVVWIGPMLAGLLGFGAALTFLRGVEDDAPADLSSAGADDDPYIHDLLAEVDDD